MYKTSSRLFAIALASVSLSSGLNAKDVAASTASTCGTEHEAVERILAQLDRTTAPAETLADLYLDDAVILQPGQAEVRGRAEVIELMRLQAAGPSLEMRHRVDECTVLSDAIVVQGGVVGTAQPGDGSGPFPFATKNLILLKRDGNDELKIWKVIFNTAPLETSEP